MICGPSYVYMKAIKQCQYRCSKESFLVLDGDEIVFKSPLCEDDELRILEGCLPPSRDLQYSLMLVDASGNSWSSGSWLEIVGEYGNSIFKSYLTELFEEVYSLSFYRPILKDDVWKLTYNMITGSWISYEYSDSAWSSVTLGSVTVVVMGTQYLRKKFVGLIGMASYELSMFYQYGVVAYVNGREVVRDNMPAGSIQSSTYASKMYEMESYHSFVRPGTEVISDKSILAVELHFVQGVQQTSCTFNAYMALYAPSVPSSPCWVVPFEVTISSQTSAMSEQASDTEFSSSFHLTDAINDPFQAFNFNKDDSFDINPFTATTLDFFFDSTIRPYVNGLRFWPSADVYNMPYELFFGGSMAKSENPSLWMMHVSNIHFTSNQYSLFYAYLNTDVFSSYRLRIPTGNGQALFLFEVQPLVCALDIPQSIPFDSSIYSVILDQEIDPISPTIYGFTKCSVLPALPDGLYIDEETCTIYGTPTHIQSLTKYRVISTNGTVLSGEVRIEVIKPEGTRVLIRRQYGDKALEESFSVFSEEDGSLLYSVPVNSGQLSFTTTEITLYVTCSLIRIVLDCVSKSWSPNSYLYVYLLLDDKETETLLRATFDEYLSLPSFYVLSVQFVIPPKSTWYFYGISIPENWYNEDVDGWESGCRDEFPYSHSQIQLYKKLFSIESLSQASGFVVDIRYLYGVILYVNGVEVFRNHVTGPLNRNLYAQSLYDTLLYRSVSLPIRTIAVKKSSTDYLFEGQNIIAIAVIAQRRNQVVSYFDCALHLLPLIESSRVFEYNVASSSCISGSDGFVFHHSFLMKSVDCPNGDLVISFANDRHEWISSLVVQAAYDSLENVPEGFTVSGRKSEDSNWKVLSVVEDLIFFLPGQSIRIWFENNQPFNEYRIQHFNNQGKLVTINRIDLFSDCTTMTISNLTYSDAILYRDIQMTELYPSSSYFTNFTIHPSLPEGLFMDHFTGIIQGLVSDEITDYHFTVTARRVTGGWDSASFHLFLEVCEDSSTLVSITLKTSRFHDNSRLIITQGNQNIDNPVFVVDPIPCCNAFVYETVCLIYDVYTMFYEERLVHMAHIDTGFSLSLSNPPFIVDNVFVQDHAAYNVSFTFNTELPFEMKRSLWRVYSEEIPPESWTSYDFDDRTWTDMYPSQFPPIKEDTLYLRRTFYIDRLETVPVLNVYTWYIGGILVYLNGVRVARFRVSLDNTLMSTSSELISSVFHIILAVSGGRNENNVLAVKLVFSKGSIPYFDATGIYGVEACSRVLDSVTMIESSRIEDPEALFQIGTWEVVSLSNSYPYLSWYVDNEEGSLFNNYQMISRKDYEGLSYELAALAPHTDHYMALEFSINQTLLSHTPHRHSVPYGIRGYREFRWSLYRAVWTAHQFLSLSFYYCQNSVIICTAIGDFPAVTDGQISPAPCEDGFTGYRYRECFNGNFGEINTDHCRQLPPGRVSYGSNEMEFVQGISGESVTPSYEGIVNRFYLDPGYRLPEGLELDPISGVIRGIPMELVTKSFYTVYAENQGGVRSSRILITVRKGKCNGNVVLPQGQVGEEVKIDCQAVGMGIGKRTIQCVLGDKDGVWETKNGACVSYGVIIVIVIFTVAILVSGVVILLSYKKKEAMLKRRSIRHRFVSEGNRMLVVY